MMLQFYEPMILDSGCCPEHPISLILEPAPPAEAAVTGSEVTRHIVKS